MSLSATNVNVLFSYGPEINLPTSISNGTVYFVTDTKKIYLDINNKRYDMLKSAEELVDETEIVNQVLLVLEENVANIEEELRNNVQNEIQNLKDMLQVSKPIIDKAIYCSPPTTIQVMRGTANYDIVQWDGSIPETVEWEGEGTENSPYLIDTAEKLAYTVSSGGNNKYYKLTKDIDLNYHSWITILHGDYKWDKYWSGKLDGNNHTILNLTSIDTTEGDNQIRGLIPALQGNTTDNYPQIVETIIENLILKNINIKGYTSYGTGGLIGRVQNAYVTIKNCFVQGSMSGDRPGALIGGGDPASPNINIHPGAIIENCGIDVKFNTSANDQNNRPGGIVGDFWSRNEYEFTNCYSTSDFLSKGTTCTIQNCYSVNKDTAHYLQTLKQLTKEQMIGLNALDNMPELLNDFVAVENLPPQLKTAYTQEVANQTLELLCDYNPITVNTNNEGYINNLMLRGLLSSYQGFVFKSHGNLIDHINKNTTDIITVKKEIKASTIEMFHETQSGELILQPNSQYYFSCYNSDEPNSFIKLSGIQYSGDIFEQTSKSFSIITSINNQSNNAIMGYYNTNPNFSTNPESGFERFFYIQNINDNVMSYAKIEYPKNTDYFVISNKPAHTV